MTNPSEDSKKECGVKKKSMLAYGIIQLGSSAISALSLAAIALSICSIKQESYLFKECVEEVRASGQSSSAAVRFCNGGT